MERRPARSINRLLIAALLAAASASCGEGEQTADGQNIVARSQACKAGATLKNPGSTVTGSEWIDGKLVVRATDVLNCAQHQLSAPAYSVEGTEVSIRWAWKRPPDAPVAACECERMLTFELSGLKQAQYTVRLQKSE